MMSDRVVLKKEADSFLIPKFEIVVDESVGFTVKVFGAYPGGGYSLVRA